MWSTVRTMLALEADIAVCPEVRLGSVEVRPILEFDPRRD